jgi:NADPH:quinone reductase-like Zn-dependent oxidoreductase
MAYPRTCRSFRSTEPPYPLTVQPSTETLPETLKHHDVVIRIHAVSLNFRDVAILHKGRYPAPAELRGIPASDCAAEVVAIGDGVHEFKLGDHVAPIFNMTNIDGTERDFEAVALGGDGPGVLREFAVFEDAFLVKLPQHLSWEEV